MCDHQREMIWKGDHTIIFLVCSGGQLQKPLQVTRLQRATVSVTGRSRVSAVSHTR